MTKAKKGISLVLMSLLLCMQFLLVGCGSASSGKKIVFITQRLNNGEYFENISKAFEKTITKEGYAYEFTGPQDWDAKFQGDVLKEVVKSKPAAIILAPVVGDELYEAIREANEAGVPIILIDTDLDRELLEAARVKVDTFVGIDNYEGGKLVADKVSETLEKGSKVAIVGGGVETPTGEERCRGFKDEITAKGMEVVGRFTTNWSEEEGYERGKVFLTAHPDIKMVFAANSSILKGIVRAAEEKNISIQGATFERDAITDEYKDKGILLCTYDQNIEGLAEKVSEVIKKIKSGEKLENVTVSEGKLYS